MNFLNWPTALTAAALTIPPLVALYFLKLKRHSVPIPSTLLWKRAVQDLQVNSPFQRLRNNLLLWLQLLILLLAAAALARPIFMADKKRAKALILLIDRSSSMNVREADGLTRLEKAKQQAKLVIDDMHEDDETMVITFTDRARMASAFTSDKAALRRLVDEIEPSEGLSLLGEALQLAQAYSDPQIIAGETAGSDVTPESTSADAQIILFSDGRIADAEQLVLRRAGMELVNVAKTDDNVGIVALDVRRNYETPEILSVFARIRNFSSQSVTTDVSLTLQGRVVDVQEISLDPGRAEAAPSPTAGPATTTGPARNPAAGPPPGSVGLVIFGTVTFEGSGPLEVRIERADALPADNRAWAIVQPPRHIKVLLVTAGNYFLERALSSLAVDCQTLEPDRYETAPEEKITDGGRSKYDVVIFDDHSTGRLPPGNYFFFGGVPEIEGVTRGEVVQDQVIVDWDDAHPILRHVNLESVYVFQWNRLTLPDQARTIIEGETTPVMAYLARDGRQYLISAFSILDRQRKTIVTQWVLKWHFLAMISDALGYLSANVSAGTGDIVRPGQAVNLLVPENAKTITVTRPDGNDQTVPVRLGNVANYANTRAFGLYHVRPAAPGNDIFGVNLTDDAESNIAPNPRLVIGGDAVSSAETSQRITKPVWPWLLAAALAILMLEWIIYNRRVFV